jgi:MscS family membrane protein
MSVDFLSHTFLGNTVQQYCWFLGILLLGIIVKKFLSRILAQLTFRIVKKYSSGVGFDTFLELLKAPFGLFVLLITLYFAFDQLEFPVSWKLVSEEKFGLKMILFRSFQISIVVSITWILLRLADYFGVILIHRASLTESKVDDQFVPFVKESIKVIIGIFSLFFILGSICNINIASLIAGLGIGGLAFALAAKESIENLLGSFTIFLDKPFIVGDLVQIGSVSGNVEKIGFRSTSIRTLDKSYVTVPNKKLVEAELDNLSLRTLRRVKLTLNLSYSNSPEQLKSFIADLKQYIASNPLTSQELQVRLFELGKNSIDVLVLYFIETIEYDFYLDMREKVNYQLLEIAHKNNISFANTNPFMVEPAK